MYNSTDSVFVTALAYFDLEAAWSSSSLYTDLVLSVAETWKGVKPVLSFTDGSASDDSNVLTMSNWSS